MADYTYHFDFIRRLEEHLANTKGVYVVTEPQKYGCLHVFCTNATQSLIVFSFCQREGYQVMHEAEGERCWIQIAEKF